MISSSNLAWILPFGTLLVLSACVVYMPSNVQPTYTPCPTYTPYPTPTAGQTGSGSSSGQTSTCQDMYPQCYSWETAPQYAGQGSTCFIGRISKVYYEHDDLSNSDSWTAYFDPQAANWPHDTYNHTVGLRIVSVERDISNYEGQCVAVFGKVLPPVEGFTVVGRSMVDSAPYDDRVGFRIVPCLWSPD